MLFKEKILLSNCDSVRKHSENEIKKRLLLGFVFGNGVVLSPNILFDNAGVESVLEQKNIIKFLNEEGYGQFVVRGVNLGEVQSASDYFERLPNDYAMSSLNGKLKGTLTKNELHTINQKIIKLDDIMKEIHPTFENALISENSLSDEIYSRLSLNYFRSEEEYKAFLEYTKKLVSRSQWYSYVENNQRSQFSSAILKAEIIDPAYNSLFIYKGEGFIQDNITTFLEVPSQILSAGITLKSLRREINLVRYAIDKFELICSLGTNELSKIITDYALDYLEDYLKENGEIVCSRKDWFGLYPQLRQKMGIEIK